MNKKRYGPYSWIGILTILLVGLTPVYGLGENHNSEDTLSFVDTTKDPNYYIERYYNEPKYRAWFDRNYPDYTIEEAVGYSTENNRISNKIIPEAEALSSNTSNNIGNNNETSQIILAIAALAILFGATYGIKRKVDDNSRQISINRNKIKQKIMKPIIGSNPIEILQTRLAKGEITIEEYYKIKKELETN
ncbi:MAG: hypothetical protein R3327_05710 [Nitrosopumilaceae archaeon]|nr:hypothetical protein [Nitrosopumilaceae archaeon]